LAREQALQVRETEVNRKERDMALKESALAAVSQVPEYEALRGQSFITPWLKPLAPRRSFVPVRLDFNAGVDGKATVCSPILVLDSDDEEVFVYVAIPYTCPISFHTLYSVLY
jgi:hypothetical protein